MSLLALLCAVVALVLLVPVRIALQRRWTGTSGVVLAGAAPGPPRTARGLMAGGTLLVGAGPLLHLAGLDGLAWEPADPFLTRATGFLLAAGGIGWTFWAQVTMRDAWRIGQDDAERLPLVTAGPFATVRHPIYSGMVAIALGITLLDATGPGLLGALLLSTGAIVQALRVEEPHLREVHGTAYWDWARHTGRFLPRMR